VRCGPNDCAYGNPCLAEAAGFSPDDGCKPVSDIPEPQPGTCPVTDPAVSCINEADPVICGGADDCEYSNLCLAIGAGFQQSDCFSSQCPEPDPAESCPETMLPVTCDDCIYDNICSAGAAGFLETDCEESVGTIPGPDIAVDPSTGKPSCPFGNRGFSICPESANPVLCAGTCKYDNLCSAQSGPGFTEEDCVPIFDGELIEVNPIEQIECPESNEPGLVCATVYDPIVCGDCVYSNGCVASGAGYEAGDCEPLEEPLGPISSGPPDIPVDPSTGKPICPITGFPPCPETFKPVLCAGICEYDNLCSAQEGGPGFSDEMCEPIMIPFKEPRETCPETDPVPCDKMYDPVICKDACTYGNLCLGVGAGFLESDCLPEPTEIAESKEICPETGLGPCNKMYDPVICKDNCAYGNLCLGVGAGFLESDCLPEAR
jgi:hypothetical protein